MNENNSLIEHLHKFLMQKCAIDYKLATLHLEICKLSHINFTYAKNPFKIREYVVV